METIRGAAAALSVAVFAAGWTHEKIPEDAQGEEAPSGQQPRLVETIARWRFNRLHFRPKYR